eukprot:60763_1
MEDRMALEHVLAFRTIAGHEVSAELDKKSALDSTRDVSLDGGGWWGTIFGSSPEVDAGAFRLNEEERKGLFKAIDWDGSMRAVILPSDYVSTRLTLDLEYAGLDLHDGDTSLTSCSVAGSVMVERRPSSSVTHLHVRSIEVLDLVHSNSKFKRVLVHESHAESASSPSSDIIHLALEENPLNSTADLKVDLWMAPLEFVYIARWVKKLVQFFSPSESGTSLWASAWREQKQAELMNAL